jgi:hypothetical protein
MWRHIHQILQSEGVVLRHKVVECVRSYEIDTIFALSGLVSPNVLLRQTWLSVLSEEEMELKRRLEMGSEKR